MSQFPFIVLSNSLNPKTVAWFGKFHRNTLDSNQKTINPQNSLVVQLAENAGVCHSSSPFSCFVWFHRTDRGFTAPRGCKDPSHVLERNVPAPGVRTVGHRRGTQKKQKATTSRKSRARGSISSTSIKW